MIETLRTLLSEPISGSSLALFRAAMGLVLFISVIRNARIWVDFYSLSPFYFRYRLLSFLRPLPRPALWAATSLLALSALCLMLGLFYPYCAWMAMISYGYFNFMDRSTYNNHNWLMVLLLFLLAYTHCGTALALDNVLFERVPAETIPRWHLLIFQLQLMIVYVFGGLNKIHRDWLLRAMPMAECMASFNGKTVWGWSTYQFVGFAALGKGLQRLFFHPFTAYFFSWTGCVFDIVIIPLLMFPQTHIITVPMFLFFHLFNAWFFYIGIFPYLNFATLILFLDPGSSDIVIGFFRRLL